MPDLQLGREGWTFCSGTDLTAAPVCPLGARLHSMATPSVGAWKRLPEDDEDGGDVPEDSENLCDICMNRTISILMLPCKHPACDTCISKLRAANVFKVRASLLQSSSTGPACASALRRYAHDAFAHNSCMLSSL